MPKASCAINPAMLNTLSTESLALWKTSDGRMMVIATHSPF